MAQVPLMGKLLENICPRTLLHDTLIISSWHVLELSGQKLVNLIFHIATYAVDILYIVACYEDQGYTVILSGSGSDGKC